MVELIFLWECIGQFLTGVTAGCFLFGLFIQWRFRK